MTQAGLDKYKPFAPIALTDRKWPSNTITKAPIWMSTDLRDGNQALFEPMDIERKLRMFDMLVDIGFKEIEAAFPSASQTEFDFIRKLIDENRIPDDVTLEVLTQSRDHLIERTFEAMQGARRVILHLYGATSESFRRIVFNTDRAGCIKIATDGVKRVRDMVEKYPDTEWVFQYSPETFSTTELDFALEISERVFEIWQPTPQHRAILNLPVTVEAATPNIYADQIEWMCRNLSNRESIIISVHPHNDRGTAVAAAELALMAGADRVEGCLFGNGERTGNVDLVTLALNLFTQGVDPQLDMSRINHIARTYEECTQLPVHPRHPYAGDLVFTAFSGSHQDAIKKGFASQEQADVWEVPYLTIDPNDIGRTYDSIIRVNSQSGKGGISYLLESAYGLVMPRRMQVEFSAEVQRIMDSTGREQSAEDIWNAFEQAYLKAEEPIQLISHKLEETADTYHIDMEVIINGQHKRLRGHGNGPLDAALNAMDVKMTIHSFEERSMSHGSNANAMAFIEVEQEGTAGSVFGAGSSPSILQASLRALVSAVNRALTR